MAKQNQMESEQNLASPSPPEGTAAWYEYTFGPEWASLKRKGIIK